MLSQQSLSVHSLVFQSAIKQVPLIAILWKIKSLAGLETEKCLIGKDSLKIGTLKSPFWPNTAHLPNFRPIFNYFCIFSVLRDKIAPLIFEGKLLHTGITNQEPELRIVASMASMLEER